MLLVEGLDSRGTVDGDPLLEAGVERRAHRLQVPLIELVAQLFCLLLGNAAEVYVRAEVELVRVRWNRPAPPATRARGSVAEAERGGPARVIQASRARELLVLRGVVRVVPGDLADGELHFHLAQAALDLGEPGRSLPTTLLTQFIGDDFGALEDDAAAARHLRVANRARGIKLLIRSRALREDATLPKLLLLLLYRRLRLLPDTVLATALLTSGRGRNGHLLLREDAHFEILRHAGLSAQLARRHALITLGRILAPLLLPEGALHEAAAAPLSHMLRLLQLRAVRGELLLRQLDLRS